MRKRGRPKLYEGVATLREAKKEFIDECLHQEQISHLEHSVALHYRWAYTVRFGLPGPVSLDHERVKGRSIESSEAKHRYANEYYKYVSSYLASKGYHQIITNACVYGVASPIHILQEAMKELVEASEAFADNKAWK